MVKMAVFQFDEAQTERFISFHDYEEFSAFKASLSSMKRKQVGRKGRHTSRRPRRFSRSLRRRFQRNSSRMHQDSFENALDNVKKYGFSRSRGARAQVLGSYKNYYHFFDLSFSLSVKNAFIFGDLWEGCKNTRRHVRRDADIRLKRTCYQA